ncbi:MAG: hypothetical protein WD066_05765 [Planctomycetaceae bacterium]
MKNFTGSDEVWFDAKAQRNAKGKKGKEGGPKTAALPRMDRKLRVATLVEALGANSRGTW